LAAGRSAATDDQTTVDAGTTAHRSADESEFGCVVVAADSGTAVFAHHIDRVWFNRDGVLHQPGRRTLRTITPS
jgi:hypothetical protein